MGRHSDAVLRSGLPRPGPDGYMDLKGYVKPYCESCGPFRSRRMRELPRDEFGPRYICEACDKEDEQ